MQHPQDSTAARAPLTQPEAEESASVGNALVREVSRVYIGPREIPELLLISLLAGGHVLLEGVPGVAKTTLVKAFAATLGCSFSRIQFTPDLLPADITGTFVLSPKEGTFSLRQGPIFANIVLGDEINRAPAKTQSALLEAMQEKQVTVEGDTRILPDPFMVLATQNPVEHAGTYPLPEAQIDRFLVRIILGYPSREAEREMLQRFLTTSPQSQTLLPPERILQLRQRAERVHVESEVLDYVVRLARHTRESPQLLLGVSPRAVLGLVRAARARALLSGRTYAIPDDIQAVAPTVLSHRLVLTPEAEIEGIEPEAVMAKALRETRPRSR